MTTSLPLGRVDRLGRWPTVFAGAIGVSLATLYSNSAGAFLTPIEKDLGWSRTQITFGLTIAAICSAIVGPFVGVAIDRFGPRRIAVPGVIIFCATVALLSVVSTPLQWWLLWALLGLGSGGVKPTIWVAAVSSLFEKNRGLALALTLSGTGFGSIVVPLLSTRLIAIADWRMAYVYLALLYGGVTLALVLAFFRGDGDRRTRITSIARRGEAGGPDLRQTLLSRTYLLILCASILCALIQMAFVISLIPILSDWTFSRSVAAEIAASIGVTSIVGRLISGVLIDRVDARFISTVGVSIPAATAALWLLGPHSLTMVIGGAIFLGLSVGSELEAATYLTGRYFGLRHFGFLFSIILSGVTVATGLGPLLASVIRDATGSYRDLLWIAIPVSLGAASMILALGKTPKVGG